MAVRVTGAQALRRLGADLKAAGDTGKGLRRELFAGMQRSSRPVKDAARDSARSTLPAAGGLNDYVAGSRITTKVSVAGRRVGVRVQGSRHNVRSAAVEKSRRAYRRNARKAGTKAVITDPNPTVDLRAIDRGRLRHPVYGNRSVWINQQVKPRWWTDAMTGPAARVTRKEAGRAVARTKARLARG